MSNALKIAELSVQISELSALLQAAMEALQALVLSERKSQNIAGVKATFYQESQSVDHKAAVSAYIGKGKVDAIAKHTSQPAPSTSWAKVTKELNIEPIVVSPIPARVAIKVEAK